MKKLLVLVFAIALSLGALCFGASAGYSGTPTKPEQGDGTAEKPYQIGTAEELYCFAQQVNSGSTGISAVLTADITINENVLNTDGTLNGTPTYTWTPIGEYGEDGEKAYTGTFDGDGHTISGLYYDGSGNYVGLFGYVGSGGQVENVSVVDSYIGNNYSCGFTGGVCGYNNGGTITNCYNTGTVKGSYYTGGVCAANSGMIMNCYNTGSVTGSVTGSGTYTSVGGVCGGNNDRGTITNCYNTGDVTGDSLVGGVCGYNGGTIKNCYNTGTVTSNGNVGGVCGYNYAYGGDTATIENCYNTGTVTGNGNVGGVCGLNYARDDTATIENCYNTGTVSGTGTYAHVGGVCGENYGTIANCYWLTDKASSGIGSDSDSGTGGATEKTADEFKSGAVAWLLNSYQENGPWRQTLDEDDYPVLDSTHGEVVQLTVKVSGESDTYYYLNKGDKFEGKDGKVYYDNKGKRVEVPCEVTADTTLTSKTLVTVTADSFDCFVGDDKPTLTYTTSPVVEGLNVTLECDANMYAVGEYAITISGPETDDSYDFNYVNGVLKVRDSCVVTVDGEVHYVHPGESFTLPDAPSKAGYIFLGWRSSDTTYRAEEEVDITSNMSFTAVWGNLPDIDPEEPEPEPKLPFYDVAKGDWFYDAVKYVYYADLMDGVEEHIFAPNANMTRAMVWTIIARAEGIDTTGGATWYAKAQEWVVAKGISDGENPSAAITRQELVTMLWRLSGEPVVNYTLTSPDAYAISGWAYEAMRWAVSEGIIEGDDLGNLNPTANSTRAHAAAFMQRFCTVL